MSGIFSPESRFMRYMNRLADLMILILLFLLTSLPIFTIGASLTALYTVCFRLGTDREGGTFRDYFAAFRENFGQATKLWLVAVAWGLGTAVCTMLFYTMSGWAHYLFVPVGVLFAMVVLIFGYVFPLQSRFENNGITTPRSILMGALNVFPFVLLCTDLMTFLRASFAWVIIWFAAAAYVNTRILKKVFAPYLKEDDDPTQDEA